MAGCVYTKVLETGLALFSKESRDLWALGKWDCEEASTQAQERRARQLG